MEELKYPIGKYAVPSEISPENIRKWLEEMEAFPGLLRAVVLALPAGALDTPYRDGGWTARQVVHHLADSHVNAYVRFRLALTEDHPVIKPYKEALWAELHDAKSADVDLSLNLLESIHRRLVALLRTVTRESWDRTYHHPESGKDWKLSNVLSLYAWHGKHHLAHIQLAAQRHLDAQSTVNAH